MSLAHLLALLAKSAVGSWKTHLSELSEWVVNKNAECFAENEDWQAQDQTAQ